MIDEEIGKYKKKTQSNTSKSSKKSDHKHINVECLFHINTKDLFGRPLETYNHGSYCKMCGKIHNIAFHDTEKTEQGSYRVLSNDEVLEKYKELSVIDIKSISDLYVPITIGGKNGN